MRSPGFEREPNEDSVAEIASLSLLWQNKPQIKLFSAALVGIESNLNLYWDSNRGGVAQILKELQVQETPLADQRTKKCLPSSDMTFAAKIWGA